MSSHDPGAEPQRAAEQGPARAPDAPAARAAHRDGPVLPVGMLRAAALAAGIVAGLVAWQVGERLHGAFVPQLVRPPNYDTMGTYEKRDFDAEAELNARPAAEIKNAAVVFGVLGAVTGAALGLVAGLSRQSVPSALIAAGAGLVSGGVAGAIGSAAFVPVFFHFYDPESGILLPMGVHCGIWAILGAGAGLGLGLGTGDRRSIPRAVLGGLFGGLAGTVAFEVINAVAFPLLRVEQTIPADSYARLAAHLCVAVGVAVGAALAIKGGRPAAESIGAPAPAA